MALTWFRYHADALDNPRVQNTPDHLFKMWVNLQCILAHERASNAGKLPPVKDVAFRLRKSVEETVRNLDDLVEIGLLKSKTVTVGDGNGDESVTECDGNGPQKSLAVFSQEKEYFLKNWANKQYKSDSSTERTQRYRERHGNAQGTPSDQIRTDTDTDQNQTPTDLSNFDIEKYLDDKSRQWSKANAPGWDLHYLIRTFNDLVRSGTFSKPEKPGPAFASWCKSFAKGKTP